MTCTELLIKYLKTLGWEEKYPDDFIELPAEVLIAGVKALEEKKRLKNDY